MIIVNTKNRNMPHPLLNFKTKGKMKYFTDAFATVAFSSTINRFAKGIFIVFLCSLVSFNINGQCDFTSPAMNIIRVIPANDSLSKVDSTIITNQLNPDGGLCRLYWIDPQDQTDTTLFSNSDTIHVYCPIANVTVTGDSIFSGSMVTFLVGETMAGPFATVTVTFSVTDNNAPTFTTPRDTIINCQSDTSVAILGGVSNVMETCSGVQDTLHRDTLITSGVSITMDTIQQIMRIWTMTDNSNNMVSDTQLITIIDTFPPVWDTVQVGIASPDTSLTLQNDLIQWYSADTLKVVMDTSGTLGANTSYFWTNIFKPSAIDSCFGVYDTLSRNNILMIDQDTTFLNCEMVTGTGASVISNHAVFLIERKFKAVDRVGNPLGDMNAMTPIDSGSFVLQIYFIDTLPPVVVDTPFYTGGLDMRVDSFKMDISANTIKIDTFIVYNDIDSCNARIDSAAIDIFARDTFTKDSVLYSWKVETLAGMAPDTLVPPEGFTLNNNDAAQTYPVGLHKITYFFKDTICDNLDSLQFVLEVRDTQAPVVVNSLFRDTLYYNSINPGNCDQEFTYQQPGLGSTFVEDNCGITPAELSITRVLSADSDPDIFTNATSGTFGVTDYGDPITIDLPIDITTIYYIYEDLQGNLDTITYIFDVRDTVPPIVNCVSNLPNLEVNNSNTCIGPIPDYTLNTTYVTASDICGAVSLVQKPSPGTMVSDTTTVTFIATDASGNMDSCSLELIVIGTQIPTLTDTTTQCVALTLEAPTVIFNCSDTVALQPLSGELENGTTPKSYTFYKLGNTSSRTINWFYNDANGLNIIPHELTFIADTTEPTIIPPLGTVFLYLDSMGMISVDPMSLDSATYDNCTPQDSLILTTDITLIPCDSLNKTFNIKLFVEDELMNIDSKSVSVIVLDSLAPIFLDVPDSLYLSCADEIPGQAVLVAIENCGMVDTMYMDTINTRPDTSTIPLVTMDTLLRDSAYYNFDIIYKWIAKDTVGNIDSVQQVIQIRDTLAPVFAYTSPLLIGTAADANDCSVSLDINLLTDLTDNCSDTIFTRVDFDGNGFDSNDTTMISLTIPMGRDTIIIESRDVSNNISTDTLIIVVDDQTDPRPVCINAVAIPVNAFGYVAIDSADINLNSTDNCTITDNLRFELSRDTFRCGDVGSTFEVIMTVIDEADNRHSCSSQVTIQDFTGTGSFACAGNITIACDASIDPNDTGTPTVTDVCGDNSMLTYSDNVVAGSGVDNVCQIIERTWMATDTSGTVTTCVQFISLVDSIAPVLTQSFNDTTVTCIADAITADSILATDNCVADDYVQAVETITIGTGNITLQKIWMASDSCRTMADTQIITITDVIAPAINFPSDTFVYNTGNNIPDSCGVFVTIDFTTFVTDCNAILGLRVGYNGQDSTAILARYFTVGEHIVNVTAKDTSGNIATKNLLIDVNDTSTPTIICVENLVVSLGTGGTGILQVSDILSSVRDNCGDALSIDTTFLSQTVFNCTDLGMQQVTLTAIDSSGNAGTCIANLEVVNQGNTDFISITTESQDESLIGLEDGLAWVTVIGGSGNYTVQWDDPANSTTDTIKDLEPELYSVIVNDTTTGCRLTDTVRVNQGTVVTYHIGDVSGMPGSIVQVPVSVINFTNVTSIDMSFNLSNPGLAQFVANNEAGGFNVPGISLTSFNIDPDNSSSLLVGPNLDPQNGQTVADGTVIFYINVQIPANAVIGSTIDVTGGGNSEADIKTGLLINGSPVDLVAQSTSGTITVTNVNNNLAFGGKIDLINGNPFANATVVLSGAVSAEDSTGTDGTYRFTVSSGQNITVTPTENENARNGLSTFDLVLIQDHINGRLLDSPYKRLAADIDKSGSISIFDIIEIQDVVLKRKASFTEVPSWVFVPAAHTFDNPSNPWAGTVPTSITANASAADTALNFIAIKSGDVSLDADEVRFQGNEIAEDRNKDFAFQVTDQIVESGTYIEVPFKATNFNQIRGYQMTVDIASDWLTFETVKAGALADISKGNFGLANSKRGQIATNWFSNTAQTVEDGATLFTLVFKVEKTGSRLSDLMQITSDMIQAEAYTDDLFYNGIDLVFEENPAIVEMFELFQNQPNPFRTETTISFNLPEKAPVVLRFFDFSGRMTHQVKGDYSSGKNFVRVNKNDLSANGVLYYELSTPGFTGRKKMIVLE